MGGVRGLRGLERAGRAERVERAGRVWEGSAEVVGLERA